MEQQPLVSVIINCYNGEKYLREAIDSVIAQTYTNWELIFWDNQSTDSTAEIVKSYKDERIRYFYAPEHTPLGEARNLAMKEAKGEYICFLDSDDIWVNDFLMIYNTYIAKYKNAGLFFSKFINDDGKRKWYSTNTSKAYIVSIKEFINEYKLGMSSICFSRKIIDSKRIKFDPEFSLIEDFDFFIKIRQYTDAVFIPEPLMIYKIHSCNLSKSDKWTAEFENLICKIQKRELSYEILYDYLKFVKIRRNYYCIRDYLCKNQRIAALRLAFESFLVHYKCIRYVLYVIFGDSLALTIRKLLFHR